MSLGEGDTPAEAAPLLAQHLGLESLVLKREDLNPTGSHKDRGAAFQLSALGEVLPKGGWVVISSSGNAAIAAAAYARLAGLRLAAFVAPGTAAAKIRRISDLGARVFVSERAMGLAAETALALGAPNLRPSTDPLAVEGFLSLGWELALLASPADALFTFASSGTSLVGIGRAFARAREVLNVEVDVSPQIHVVQGTGAQTIAGPLDARISAAVPSRLGAQGAAKTRRLGEAVRLVRASGGRGWVITDAEAVEAQRLLARHGIPAALEAAAALAAAGRAARETGLRRAVVLVTGGNAEDGEANGAADDGEANGAADDGAASGDAARGGPAGDEVPDLWNGRIFRVSTLPEVLAVIGQ